MRKNARDSLKELVFCSLYWYLGLVMQNIACFLFVTM